MGRIHNISESEYVMRGNNHGSKLKIINDLSCFFKANISKSPPDGHPWYQKYFILNRLTNA